MNTKITKSVTRKTFILKWQIIIGAFFIGYLVYFAVRFFFFPIQLRISHETTVVSGPILADGSIDYMTYIDQEWSKGVTAENNAAVLLIDVFPAHEIGIDQIKQIEQRYNVRRKIAFESGLHHEQEFLQKAGYSTEEIDQLVEKFTEAWKSEAEIPKEVLLWLEEYETEIDLIVQATHRNRFHYPMISHGGDRSLSELQAGMSQRLRIGARALLARSRVRLLRGEFEKALDDCVAMHRLASLAAQHPMSIEQILANVVQEFAERSTESIALHVKLDAHLLKSARKSLQEIPIRRSFSENYDHVNRLEVLDTMIKIFQETPFAFYLLNLNTVLIEVNQAMDEMTVALKTENSRLRIKNVLLVTERWDLKATQPASPLDDVNILLTTKAEARSRKMAQILITLHLFSVETLLHSRIKSEIWKTLSVTGLAVAEFAAKNGRYPGALEELVPDYFDEIPIDPYSDQPMLYQQSSNTFMIYSVGENEIDDGGRAVEDQTEPEETWDDLRFGKLIE